MSTFAATMRRFVLRRGEPDYPEQLAEIPDPPLRLYGIGSADFLVRGLAVIGSRNATPYGLAAARLFASWAATQDVVVVSGGAAGCDQAAHRAALDVGGRTIAVLGCGADVDYPSGARSLLQAIRSKGCVVSEQAWGTPPLRWAFARRNRIIAGLSDAVLVVEAAVPSGTFSTADAAADAGRDVLAVPGSIFAPECRGSNRLLRQGATPVTEVDDLAQVLALSGHQLLAGTPTAVVPPPDNDPVLRALVANPTRPDDVAHQFGMSIVETMRYLGRLEQAGFIARYPNGRYGRA